MATPALDRRRFLQVGALGLSLPAWMQLRAASAAGGQGGKAKSCIVLFAWGGMSHLDTWDLKPQAVPEIRGEFKPISTSVAGIQIGEHLPRLATQAHRLAIVRSVHHKASDHREAAYWNLTGHEPRRLGVPAVLPSVEDWPSLGAMVSRAVDDRRRAAVATLPSAVTLPYPCADRGLLNGQYGGFLGTRFEPVFLHPGVGTPYSGVSPPTGNINLNLPEGLSRERVANRRGLLAQLEHRTERGLRTAAEQATQAQQQALNLLLDPAVQAAFDVRREPTPLREMYGQHVCGQSVLMARRLSEAGVPLVTVNCGAGDLNSGQGAHWDTHGDNFNRLKRDLLPPLDQASTALVADLAERGRLDETLVVWLTEFGRTPRINGAGRDHFPGCYSVAFAGGGIAGGQVYGSSDKTGTAPFTGACGPEDLHATIFRALGIDPNFTFHDLQGRPHPLTAGRPLPIFA